MVVNKRARGREQFTVTRDFIPFTLEVLQSKYLLFLIYLKFSKAGINLQQIDLAGWAGVFACKILSGWARVFAGVSVSAFPSRC